MSSGPAHAPRSVMVCFAMAVLGAAGFAVAYSLGLGTPAMGATLGGALLFLALGLAIWSRLIDASEPDYVEERAVGPTPPEQFALFRDALTQQPVPRSGVLWAMLGLAATSIAGAGLFPLRSLLPSMDADPDAQLRETPMKKGVLLVTEDGRPVRAEDLELGGVVTVFAHGLEPRQHADMTTLLVRVDPATLDLPAGREDWSVDGVVAYSKLCTHAGCPVGLYADTYQELVCPCHHSVFDVLRGAKCVEGPAPHPLPQLPLAADSDGYLRANGDFSGPVGPGWWGYP